MQAQRLSLYAGALCVATAMLTGCGGSQPPIGAPGAMPQTRAITNTAHDKSWIAPEAKSEDLLYVSDGPPANNVTVYSYERHNLVGTLAGFSYPAGVCANKAGDVFIANEDGDNILEYAHGGASPIQSLPDSDGAIDCAVDRVTGNLAVANAGYVVGPPGSLYVYKNGSGSPTIYTDGNYILHFTSCVYDDEGDLFVDGFGDGSGNGGVGFAELPKGAATFTNIKLVPKPGRYALPGGLSWDGEHVTLYGGKRNVIYRLKVDGGRAHHRHYTSLKGGYTDNEYWIQPASRRQQQILIGADNLNVSEVLYWNYPVGGNPIAVITDGVENPVGVAVSLAPR